MTETTPPTETSVIIADDHPIFRRGLRAVIDAEPLINVVAEADDGKTAFEAICLHEPDVAILDLDMPVKDGFEVARAIISERLAVGVIILTMHNSESLFNAALNIGINGFVLKDSAMPEIIDGIKAVAAGGHYISPQLSTFLVGRGNRALSLERQTPGLLRMTPTERMVIRLIAEERTSRSIADELNVSIRTIDRHRANICLKLDLRGSNALVKFALKNKAQL